MPALALTDHGTMFGVVDFYRAAKAAGIKPIMGMETYLAPRGMRDREPQLDSRAFHQLLLAENDTGYRNLLQIASAAQLDGFYYRPRIDHDYLAAHSEGLIVQHRLPFGRDPARPGRWAARARPAPGRLVLRGLRPRSLLL